MLLKDVRSKMNRKCRFAPPLPNVQILGPKLYDPGLPLKRGPGLRGISLKSCVAKVQPAGHTKAAPVQTEAQSHTEGPRAPTKATRGRQMVQHQAPYQCHRALGRPSANKQSQFSGELLGYKIRLSTPGQLMRKSHMYKKVKKTYYMSAGFAGRHVVNFEDLSIDVFLEVQNKRYS